MSARIRAFLIHLFVSALVILSLVAYVRWVWYPGGLFWLEGVTDPLTVLFGVDVVLGPLLTLLLYVPGKRGLKFDMGMIVALQLAALVYGSHVLWNARPVAVAFNGEVFQVARAYEMPETQLPGWAGPGSPLGGPAFVFADLSDDPEFVWKVLMEGHPDIHLLPEQYRPLADRMTSLNMAAYRLEALADNELFSQAWQRALPETLSGAAPYLVLPIYGRVSDGAVVLNEEDGSMAAILDVDIIGVDGASPRLTEAQEDEAGADGAQEDDPAAEPPDQVAPPARHADGG